jgi:hypothetical protein
LCARRALLVGGRRPHRKVNAQRPGKAEDESAPEWEAPDSPRAAESPGERRVFVPLVLAGRLFLRVSAPLPMRGRRVWEECPESAPFDASASTPRGASGLVGAPTPDDPRSYSITLSTHLLHQEIRGSVGAAARTGGRPLPPNHARPQAGSCLRLVPLRLVYRPEPVREPQGPS